MPKETVRIPELSSDEDREWREVQVGWRQGYGYVELITRKMSDVEGFDPHDGSNGQAVHLDSWQQVNDTIKKLQQARDGAFGRPA